MAILVTGGAGYIGSHICIELLSKGHEIIVVDNFSNSNWESLNRVANITGKSIKIYDVNLLNKEKVQIIFRENKISAVIHLAGLKSVGESILLPLHYYKNNVLGTVILCGVMREYGVKRLIFSSSAAVYGNIEQVPVSEEEHLKAINPYGRTKQIIEQILQDLYDSDNEWSIALLRYFNPVGAHISGQIGEDPQQIPSNLMPHICQVATNKRQYVFVYGNDYPTTDGTGIRDYIHVVDLAAGHVKALEKVKNTAGVEAYNLGTGKGYSVLEVIETCSTIMERSIPYIVVDRRVGDVAKSYANPSKAKHKLGWQANKGLEQMCEDTWRWQQNNPSGYGN